MTDPKPIDAAAEARRMATETADGVRAMPPAMSPNRIVTRARLIELCNHVEALAGHVEALAGENQRMREALKFYANPEAWNGIIELAAVASGDATGPEAMRDAGAVACAALAAPAKGQGAESGG